jgi:DNA-binding transcriptional LysR family regulator
MDTIDGMRAVVAVAQQQSFTKGAAQLNISTKLASKYVQQLEQRLETQIFHRTTRSVTLTDTGQAYLERCIPLLEQFDELEDVVQQRQSKIAGAIRIAAPTAFGSKELVDALLPFQQAHPDISIQLQLSDQRISLIEEGIDIAIRFGKLEDSSLIARRLLQMRMVVFASTDYLKKHGEPIHPNALATHNCLLQKASVDPDHWQFNIEGKLQAVPVSGSFHANAPRAIAQMAAGGLGIGMCPIYIVQPYLDSGELTVLFSEFETKAFSLYALYPPNRHLSARIRALIDHLASELNQ